MLTVCRGSETGEKTQLSFLSVATTKCCIRGQTQASHNLLVMKCLRSDPHPSLFSQPLLENLVSPSSVPAFSVTRTSKCSTQPLENVHAILNVELRSENACKPHLPHPGFRHIGEVFILIPVYKTPASLIAMRNTL